MLLNSLRVQYPPTLSRQSYPSPPTQTNKKIRSASKLQIGLQVSSLLLFLPRGFCSWDILLPCVTQQFHEQHLKKKGVGGGERRPSCHSQIRSRPLDGPETMVLCQKPMESSLLLLFEKANWFFYYMSQQAASNNGQWNAGISICFLSQSINQNFILSRQFHQV